MSSAHRWLETFRNELARLGDLLGTSFEVDEDGRATIEVDGVECWFAPSDYEAAILLHVPLATLEDAADPRALGALRLNYFEVGLAGGYLGDPNGDGTLALCCKLTPRMFTHDSIGRLIVAMVDEAKRLRETIGSSAGTPAGMTADQPAEAFAETPAATFAPIPAGSFTEMPAETFAEMPEFVGIRL